MGRLNDWLTVADWLSIPHKKCAMAIDPSQSFSTGSGHVTYFNLKIQSTMFVFVKQTQFFHHESLTLKK